MAHHCPRRAGRPDDAGAGGQECFAGSRRTMAARSHAEAGIDPHSVSCEETNWSRFPSGSPEAAAGLISSPMNCLSAASDTAGSLLRSDSRVATQTPTTLFPDRIGQPATRGWVFSATVHSAPSLGAVALPVTFWPVGVNRSAVGNVAQAIGPPAKLDRKS